MPISSKPAISHQLVGFARSDQNRSHVQLQRVRQVGHALGFGVIIFPGLVARAPRPFIGPPTTMPIGPSPSAPVSGMSSVPQVGQVGHRQPMQRAPQQWAPAPHGPSRGSGNSILPVPGASGRA